MYSKSKPHLSPSQISVHSVKVLLFLFKAKWEYDERRGERKMGRQRVSSCQIENSEDSWKKKNASISAHWQGVRKRLSLPREPPRALCSCFGNDELAPAYQEATELANKKATETLPAPSTLALWSKTILAWAEPAFTGLKTNLKKAYWRVQARAS